MSRRADHIKSIAAELVGIGNDPKQITQMQDAAIDLQPGHSVVHVNGWTGILHPDVSDTLMVHCRMSEVGQVFLDPRLLRMTQ